MLISGTLQQTKIIKRRNRLPSKRNLNEKTDPNKRLSGLSKHITAPVKGRHIGQVQSKVN